MKKIVLGLAALAGATLLASPAFAALKVGDKAPGFSIPVATNGVVSTFSLQDALKSGPVVVYFYPKAFTGGCSLEAHQFSEAIPKFEAKHVTVVGVSTDEIGTLQKFSKEVRGHQSLRCADGHHEHVQPHFLCRRHGWQDCLRP